MTSIRGMTDMNRVCELCGIGTRHRLTYALDAGNNLALLSICDDCETAIQAAPNGAVVIPSHVPMPLGVKLQNGIMISGLHGFLMPEAEAEEDIKTPVCALELEEQCSAPGCGRMKDFGKPCWCCGCTNGRPPS